MPLFQKYGSLVYEEVEPFVYIMGTPAIDEAAFLYGDDPQVFYFKTGFCG